MMLKKKALVCNKYVCLFSKAILPILVIIFLALSACGEKKQEDIPVSNNRFQQLSASQTGVDFENKLRYDKDFNIFTYRNFYNGGGVAAGDLNGDGLTDLYFSANMGPNKLYINEGDFRFREHKAAEGERSWSTGVSLADINSDGRLDIYVCNSGDVKGDNKANELFINLGNDEDGNPKFEEKAAEYNLDDRGFSTHAAFFDYDRDGDLDCYVLNNSYRAIGSFDLKRNERENRDPEGGDRLYRNDNGRYVDVSEEAGMYGSVIGFGLGVTVGDINRDGWQDLFISNDFFERDYLYINNQDGTFREVLPKAMRSVSAASMGADMADMNNDGWAEIFVTDMLPEPDDRIKQVTTFDDWNRYQLLLDADYYHQFTRNMLHLNRGMVKGDETPVFTEVSRYAGVEATDWSWGALLFDMDLDGRKDLFIANGIYQDLTDQDYLNFIANDETKRAAVSGGSVDYRKLIDPMPSVPVPNYAYRNVAEEGEIPRFENVANDWGLARPSFSNGSAYADLDNDGDLDLIINNVNMEAFIYRNQSRQMNPENHYLRISLRGKAGNTQALGTQIIVWAGGKQHMLEQMPVRGFQSTMDERPLFGLGESERIDSMLIRWPDGTVATGYDLPVDTTLVFDWGKSGIRGKMPVEKKHAFSLRLKKTGGIGLDFTHKENSFVDFNRDRMVYNMRSTEGPAMCKGDFNGDGREDLYIGGAKDSPGALFIQKRKGEFSEKKQPAFERDKASEDTNCACFDADGDGDLDLYVTSGGNEFPTSSSSLGDRLYINNGRGKFSRKDEQILPAGNYESTRAVAAADFDKDGDMDLFVGVRLVPFRFGTPGNGYLLENDGSGKFKVLDVEELKGLGLITAASWADVDGDKDQDLIVVAEWMAPTLFVNDDGVLVRRNTGLESLSGWWQSVEFADLNGDKLPDLILGNHGLNSRCAAEEGKPLTMFVKDFDKNGTPEQFLCRYENGKLLPFIRRHDLGMQLPKMKKRYLEFNSYVGQSIFDIYSEEELAGAMKYEANTMQSMVGINQGDGSFKAMALPAEAQLAPLFALAASDLNADGKMDLVVGGNLYHVKPEMGRYDALHGLVMLGDGAGGFEVLSAQESGLWQEGEMRKFEFVNVGGKQLLVAAMNDAQLAVFEVKK
jgi:hypothetical protein